MSERGVFALDRGWFDHAAFADEPFTEREAWAWLIAEAAYKPRTRRIGTHELSLQRGQLAASVRFLAERWQWSKSRVHRFLDRLKNRDMIETDSGTGVIVVTVCNYDIYQRVSLPSGTDAGTQSGTAAGQQRDKREDNKNTEDTSSLRSEESERKPARAKSDRGSRVDPNFWPNETGLAVAAEEGITGQSLQREVAHFIDHHTQKGTLGKDWQAGWRTWCRSPYRKREQPVRAPPPQSTRPRSNADLMTELALEADENLRRKRNGDGPFDGEIIPFGSRPGEPSARYAYAPDAERSGADRGPLQPESYSLLRLARS